ncbi:MAG TPA: DedA family protein [Acidimicrobiales bacterium]|nr:DedA family protein [Acidimicrobiales bacterium]
MILAGLSDFVFGDLSRWVEDVIDAIGYLGVALLVALENVFPPIPSEVVLPAAGLYAEKNGGVLPLIGMVLAATAGSVAGAWVLYAVAAWVGPDRLRAFVVRRGRWFGVKEGDLDKAEGWFDRREDLAVLVCRCIPLVRSVVSIPAGFRRMPKARFTLYTALGSLVWNTALILVGYAASSYQDEVETIIGYVQYVVVLAIVVAVGWFVWRRIIRARLHPDHGDDTGPTGAEVRDEVPGSTR